MKIALVTPYDYPYPGGVTEHVRHLDREFRARGHETRIIAPSTQEASALDANVTRVSGDVLPIPFNGSTARIALSPAIQQHVAQVLSDEQFDVVHLHEPEAPLVNWAVLQASRTVNVGTFHAYPEDKGLFERLHPFLEWVWLELDGRIFVSPALRDAMAPYTFGESRVIPNGIDYARFAAAEVTPIAEYADGRPNILFVGRLDPRKGFSHLLSAFPQIKRAVPAARLLVVGAFGEEEKARLAEKLSVEELRDVHLIGRVPADELPRYYRTATIFCAPSTGGESFGIVLLEAMAAGAPIVASDIAGYRSVMQNGVQGRFAAPRDEPALAEMIVALLLDAESRAQMSARGRETAARYDWSIVAPQVLAYYQELLETRPHWRALAQGASASQHEQSLMAPEAAHVVLDIRGHLRLEGWDRAEVCASARGDGEVHVEMRDDTVNVIGVTDGREYRVYVPRAASVHITYLGAHGLIRGLSQPLEIERVAGHLRLEQVAAAHVGRVSGHLTAAHIEGSLDCGTIGGNLTVHLMAGDLSAHARGNVSIDGLDGAIQLRTDGKVLVTWLPYPGRATHAASAIQAAGRIRLRLSPGADATLAIEDARGVRNRVFKSGRTQVTLVSRERVVMG